jgi:hypothetical protein
MARVCEQLEVNRSFVVESNTERGTTPLLKDIYGKESEDCSEITFSRQDISSPFRVAFGLIPVQHCIDLEFCHRCRILFDQYSFECVSFRGAVATS